MNLFLFCFNNFFRFLELKQQIINDFYLFILIFISKKISEKTLNIEYSIFEE